MYKRILEGIRVVDMGRFIAAPFCGQILADMGAEVIRLERPGGDVDRQRGPLTPSGRSLYYLCMNRNKKAVTLDMRSEEGKEVFTKLLGVTDVLLHNFSPGAAKTMGLQYEVLKEVNPSIICAAISGFGSDGPYAERVAFDMVAQGMSGAMSTTGFSENGPTAAHIPYCDYGTALNAALGIVLALYHRERTGVGQAFDLSLLDVGVSFVAGFAIAAEYQMSGKVRGQDGNQTVYAVGNSYKAKDGYISLSVIGNAMWAKLCGAVGHPEMAKDERFSSDIRRYENRDLVSKALGRWIAQHTVEEGVTMLQGAGVPSGPVLDIKQMVADPQVGIRNMLFPAPDPELGSVLVPGTTIKFSKTPGVVERGAPDTGESNREIYQGLLGYSNERIENLKAKKVI